MEQEKRRLAVGALLILMLLKFLQELLDAIKRRRGVAPFSHDNHRRAVIEVCAQDVENTGSGVQIAVLTQLDGAFERTRAPHELRRWTGVQAKFV